LAAAGGNHLTAFTFTSRIQIGEVVGALRTGDIFKSFPGWYPVLRSDIVGQTGESRSCPWLKSPKQVCSIGVGFPQRKRTRTRTKLRFRSSVYVVFKLRFRS
jgi:hypothetical protein